MNSRELPQDRLATTKEDGGRVFLYPADVKGFFRKWRTGVHTLLLLIFVALPWVEIGGVQALLFDIPRRRFAIFGVTFWAHDAPMVVFVLGSFVFSLVLATALLGRVWCGWACPQTVFVDALFRRIERWIEGDSVERKRLAASPWGFDKLGKRGLKWILYLVISLGISHSFLAYFVGADRLLEMMATSPAVNLTPFLVMAAVTGFVAFEFGWFREQFCIIVCPYGRFQSVLMDDHSLAVAYDSARGEPRRGSAPDEAAQGDCVNCYRCVQVCPTGVDIRRGVQMECIACTACIDACDDVMTRLKKPRGLIRYTTATQLASNGRPRWLRPRTAAYAALLLLSLSGLTLSVARREALDVTFIRAVGAPYQVVETAGGERLVVNHYKMDLANQSASPMRVSIEGIPGLEMVSPELPKRIEAGEAERVSVFFKIPASMLTSGRMTSKVTLTGSSESGAREADRTVRIQKEVTFVGPFR